MERLTICMERLVYESASGHRMEIEDYLEKIVYKGLRDANAGTAADDGAEDQYTGEDDATIERPV